MQEMKNQLTDMGTKFKDTVSEKAKELQKKVEESPEIQKMQNTMKQGLTQAGKQMEGTINKGMNLATKQMEQGLQKAQQGVQSTMEKVGEQLNKSPVGGKRRYKKGSRSKTRHGRKDFITHKGSKKYNRKGHRQSRNSKGRKGKPYTRRMKRGGFTVV
jgi:hypothetical protein